VNFSPFWDAAHILTLNCDEVAEIDQDNLRMKFSALNVYFNSPRPDPLDLRRPAKASVKDGYPPKSGYFTAIDSCSLKTVADKCRHTAYHGNGGQSGVNINVTVN